MARTLGIPVTTIQYWFETGHIPTKKQQIVLDAAHKHGLSVSANDFFEAQT